MLRAERFGQPMTAFVSPKALAPMANTHPAFRLLAVFRYAGARVSRSQLPGMSPRGLATTHDREWARPELYLPTC